MPGLALIDITPDPIALRVGPLSVPWYGLGYAAAIAAGAWLGQREARRRGLDPRVVMDGLLLAVVLAVIGGRLYHVIDQWSAYASDPLRIVLPPYSGLGLYGGVVGAILGVFIYTRRHAQPFLRWLDTLVPSFLLGQAIARWGNFANQELYGPPTDAPWAIAIDCAHRIAAYACPGDPRLPVGQTGFPLQTGFHPLFFYESALNLAGVLVALWLGRRFADRLRDGDILAFWFIWYGSTRFLLEPFRSGYNWTFFGFPVATLISLAAVVGGSLWVVVRHRGRGRAMGERDPDESLAGATIEPDARAR